MNSLAFSPPKDSTPAIAIADATGDDAQFPSLNLNGTQASNAGLAGVKVGDVIEVTIKANVRGVEQSRYGGKHPAPSVDLDITHMDAPEIESAKEDDAEGIAGEDAEDETGENEAPEIPEKKPKQKVMSPKDLGM